MSDYSEDLNPIQSAIHAAICEDSPEDCLYDEGLCVKAAAAVLDGVTGWSIAEHTSDGELVALLHVECSDKDSAWFARNYAKARANWLKRRPDWDDDWLAPEAPSETDPDPLMIPLFELETSR
jgi:hypothetical protein